MALSRLRKVLRLTVYAYATAIAGVTYFCSVVGLYLYSVYLNLVWLQCKTKSGQNLRIILVGGQT